MFDHSFRACFADTPYGIALHKRIRYQVFGLAQGVGSASPFSVLHEQDQWDHYSAHFIVQNKNTGKWVAAFRLILPKEGVQLPVEVYNAFERRLLPDPDVKFAEVSRFCTVSKSMSQRSEAAIEFDPGSLETWGIGAIDRKQQFEVILGMLRALTVFALKRDIEHCVMLINDAFARMLKSIGVRLYQIGPNLEHRSMRAAYMVDIRESILSSSSKSSALRALFRQSRNSYVRISSVVDGETVDAVSEYFPDHSLFNETIFRESVLIPSEQDTGLRIEPTKPLRG